MKKSLIIFIVLLFTSLGLFAFSDEIIPEKTVVKEKEYKEKSPENLEEIGDKLLNIVNEYNLYTLSENDSIISYSTNLSESQIKSMYLYFKSNNIIINKDNIDKYIKDLCNEINTDYPDIVFNQYQASIATYDKKKKDYIVNEIDYDIPLINPVITKKNNIEKIGDNYVLTVSLVYNNGNSYFTDPLYKNKITKLDNRELEDAKIYYEQNYEQFKKNKPLYKYIFEKEDDNFYLKIYETEK